MTIKSDLKLCSVADMCVVCLTACLLYFHFARLFVYAITIDDFEHLAAAWYMHNGAFPYLDFFEHHNPLWWLVISKVFYVVDNPYDSYVAAREIAAVFFIGSLVMFGAIIYRLFHQIRPIIYGLFFYLAFPISNLCYMQNRPDTAMIFFMLVGVYTWILYAQNRCIGHLIISYLSFFISFLFLQKILLFLLPFGIYQVYLLWKKELPVKDVITACILPAAGLILFFFCLYRLGVSGAYFELNYILNLYIERDYAVYHTHPIEYILRAVAVIGMIVGILKTKGLIRQLSVVAFGFTVIFFCMPKPYEYYWFFWIPVASVSVGYWLSRLKWGWLRIEIILPFFFVPAFFYADARLGYDFSTVEMKVFQTAVPGSEEIVSPNEALYAFLKPWPKTYYFWGRALAELNENLFHRSYPVMRYKEVIKSKQPRYIGTNYPNEINGNMDKLVKEIQSDYHRLPLFRRLEIWERNAP